MKLPLEDTFISWSIAPSRMDELWAAGWWYLGPVFFRRAFIEWGGRLAPLQGMGPEQLTLDFLETRARSGQVREVIMATNPNLEGDGTALLVSNRLADTGVAITRLARGLASGSILEFANREMLADAINGRQRF